MKPYYEDNKAGITIYHGDCREILPQLASESVDLVLADPPYGISIDTSWLSALHIQRGKPANKSDAKLVGDDGSLDLSFLFTFKKWLVWGYPYINDVQATGWLVWDKWPGVNGGGIGSPVEMALTNLWKGFKIVRVLWAGYYRASGEIRVEHPTQKPLGVIKPYIQQFSQPNDLILDPFLGSGTTLRAAKDLGRRAIGIELEEKYIDIAIKRLMQEVLPLEAV
jgi:site-specific DNA-methyltransferase (adenine-specific)